MIIVLRGRATAVSLNMRLEDIAKFIIIPLSES